MGTSDWEGSEKDKEKQGPMFLAMDERTEGNKEVPEDHQTSHPLDDISESGVGDHIERACMASNTSKHCSGFT